MKNNCRTVDDQSVRWKRHSFSHAFNAILTFVVLTVAATVQSPGNEKIVFTGYYNFDKTVDSLIVSIDSSYHLQPQRIHWGACDSVLCDTSGATLPFIPDSLRVPTTTLSFPSWNDLRIEIACLRLNPVSDSLHDLLFYCSGTVTVDSIEVDTSRVIALFGQHGLDTMSALDLSGIGDSTLVQTSPFHAMIYREPTEFIDEEVREASGNSSWVIKLLNLPVATVAPPEQPSSPEFSVMPDNNTLQVYPNPGSTITSVTAEQLPPGEYKLEVLALSGQILFKREHIRVSNDQALYTEVPLGDLATGYYIIRLTNGHRIQQVIPFVIAH